VLPAGARHHLVPDGVLVELPEGGDLDELLAAARAAGAAVLSVTPRRESLEDLFLREAAAS
jgi:hypothetical protein